jgi:prepilin-type N-terminal cleavage/methylation domain-containing protein
MLARIHKSMAKKDEGFTLIELLVVMIIIGILAAIAIPVFLSQRKKAQDTAVKADVSTLGKEIATYYVDGKGVGLTETITGTAATATSVQLVDTATPAYDSGVIKLSSGTVGATVPNKNLTNNLTWCVALTNAGGQTQTFNYSAASGLGTGACP